MPMVFEDGKTYDLTGFVMEDGLTTFTDTQGQTYTSASEHVLRDATLIEGAFPEWNMLGHGYVTCLYHEKTLANGKQLASLKPVA